MILRKLFRPAYYRLAGRDANLDSFLDQVRGVIHIGANTGQESNFYASKGLKVLWIEPIPSVFQRLASNINGINGQSAVCELLSDRDGELVRFNIASNDGASSSIMKLKEHKLL
jgi:FkbM family methyltransferase